MDIPAEILWCVIEGSVRFVLYTIILWIMIKIQRFNYNWPGLLFVSALSIAISYVPEVGLYLTFPVLIGGLHAVTGASIAPDILFTVGITRALMFAIHLFVLGGLMGDLRPDLNASARTNDEGIEMAEEEESEESEPEPLEPPKPVKPPTPSGPTYALARSSHPKAKDLTVRGVTLNSTRSMVIVGSGRNFHTISTGECFQVKGTKAPTTIRCDEITKSFVLLTIDGTDQVKLRVP
jgi:hypothetical protein